MPMTWDEQADARLFAGLLTTHDISVNYTKLADFMGNGCTAKAVTHRVSKIRNLAKNYVPTNDNGNTGTVSAAGRKRGATKAEVGEAETSPAKKSKSPVKAAVPKAKAKATPIEGDDDDNQDNENGGSNAIKAEE